MTHDSQGQVFTQLYSMFKTKTGSIESLEYNLTIPIMYIQVCQGIGKWVAGIAKQFNGAYNAKRKERHVRKDF